MKGIRRGTCRSVTKAIKPPFCGGLCEWSGVGGGGSIKPERVAWP
jgi:hypothetical protein